MSLLVTIFADASLLGGKAGFGYWFKSSHAQGEGHATDDVDYEGKVTTAELQGILIAVSACVNAHKGVDDLIFLIQCDCQHALRALVSYGAICAKTSSQPIQGGKVRCKKERGIITTIGQVTKGQPIYVKWVKGHSSGCARTTVNGITDRLARKGRLSKNKAEIPATGEKLYKAKKARRKAGLRPSPVKVPVDTPFPTQWDHEPADMAPIPFVDDGNPPFKSFKANAHENPCP